MSVRFYLKIVTLTFIIFCFIFPLSIQSQTTTNKTTLTGIVIDNGTKLPLASATVALHNSKDSSIISGAVTDKDGKFSISASLDNNYYLEVKFLGYKTQIILTSAAKSKGSGLDFGEIKMEQTDVMKEGVTVEAEKEAIVFGIDSKTFNVTKDMTSSGSSIIDVLRKIPSLDVDMEDNVKMNGISPKILINGRESSMTSKEMLKAMSSELVESVELITNPSAKYESEGVAGIIDIKLKKEVDNGFNGMVSLHYGQDFEGLYNKNYGGGFYGNYKYEQFNFFANVNYSSWNNKGDGGSSRKIWDDLDNDNIFDTTFTERKYENQYHGGWYGGNFGVDYNFNERDIASLSADISGYNTNGDNISTYRLFDNDWNPKQSYDNISNTSGNSPNYQLSFNYKKGFEDDKNHNLYVDAYISSDNGNSNVEQSNKYYPILPEDNLFIDKFKSDNNDKTMSEAIQVDYERTLSLLGNLGAGVKAVFRQQVEGENSYKFDYNENTFVPDFTLINPRKYNNGILGAYFTLGKKWESFSYRVGLRAEYTMWDLYSEMLDTTFKDKYLSLSPSISLKYNIGFAHTFSLSYSRRLQRPWYSQLDPYMVISDSQSVYTGNADLQPSYYNSYSFNYMLFTKSTTITTAAFYRNTDNSSETYQTTLPWGGILSYPVNAGVNASYGASLSLNQTITDWWRFNAYAAFGNNIIEAKSLGIAKREQTYWNVNFNTSIEIIENLRSMIYFFYSPSSISLQSNNDAMYYLSAGLNYDMFDDKLSLNLNFNNLIPRSYKYSSFGPNFYADAYSNWQHPTFSLGISYKINDYKQKQTRSIDDGGSGVGGDSNTGGGAGGGI